MMESEWLSYSMILSPPPTSLSPSIRASEIQLYGDTELPHLLEYVQLRKLKKVARKGKLKT